MLFFLSGLAMSATSSGSATRPNVSSQLDLAAMTIPRLSLLTRIESSLRMLLHVEPRLESAAASTPMWSLLLPSMATSSSLNKLLVHESYLDERRLGRPDLEKSEVLSASSLPCAEERRLRGLLP